MKASDEHLSPSGKTWRRLLLVGDPHVTPDELSDCVALIRRVKTVSSEADAIVFLGDQHHNHALVSVYVMNFWKDALEELRDRDVYMLVGNHDRVNDTKSPLHGLHYDRAKVVEGPVSLGGIRLLPWYPDPVEFLKNANVGDPRTLICHQTFDGSTYENGFYAKDGIDASQVTAKSIISGHIHTPQTLGKVFYPGAPRWRTVSDANQDRHLVTAEFDDQGNLVSTFKHSTQGHCTALWQLQDTEDGAEGHVPEFVAPYRLSVDVRGSPEYVEDRTKFWVAKGARVRPFPTRQVVAAVRESDGINQALSKFITTYKPKYGTSLEVLSKAIAERIHV